MTSGPQFVEYVVLNLDKHVGKPGEFSRFLVIEMPISGFGAVVNVAQPNQICS